MTDRNVTHGLPPADDGLFAGTPTPKPRRTRPADDPGTPLFAEDRPAKRTPPASRKPYPRWRDEDMPLRPGDVLALGLTHRRAILGQVTAVNDHCIRLNSYSWLDDGFHGGIAVVGWAQVVEFGPVAGKRDGRVNTEPLRDFTNAWTEGQQ